VIQVQTDTDIILDLLQGGGVTYSTLRSAMDHDYVRVINALDALIKAGTIRRVTKPFGRYPHTCFEMNRKKASLA
jgi:predicted transcriptional regulator